MAVCSSDGGLSTSGAACDGAGTCGASTGTMCGAYLCNPASGICRTSCTTPGDCAAGKVCTNGACVDPAPAM
jgi:hypothetical protein